MERIGVACKELWFDHFCFNGIDEKTHNFLLHYQQEGRLPIEDKPLNRTYFDENLQKYWINLSEHGKTYDFYDSKDIVSAFLTVFDNNFIPRQNLRKIR